METANKYCKKCNSTKSLVEFSKNKNTPDGFQYYCKDCCRATTKHYRDNNKEAYYASARRWAEENPERVKETRRKYYLENQESILTEKKEYYQENRDSILEYKKTYGRLNRGKRNAIEAKRYASQKQRTPPWLTKEQIAEIEQYYWLAKDLFRTTGEVYHVDHIVPMQGDNVSGLHVPWNLQVLPSDVNIAKGNKHVV
jgi:hypothetical protein